MSIIGTIKDLLRQSPVYAKISYLSASDKLKGRRIIVTGGTGGIGQAMAKRFVAEGAQVLIAGRNEEKLVSVSKELGCHALRLDVTQVETFTVFLNKAIELLGGVDCLVSNAGISLHETFETVTPEGFDAQISTNLRGPFFLAQTVINYWVKNDVSGQMLFISSESGGTADVRPYGITKAALNSFVQGLAYAYIKHKIRVNAIAPGITATAMTGFNANGDLISASNQIGRVYLPEEVAELAAFLLSDAAGCISGQIVACNNGNNINARWKR